MIRSLVRPLGGPTSRAFTQPSGLLGKQRWTHRGKHDHCKEGEFGKGQQRLLSCLILPHCLLLTSCPLTPQLQSGIGRLILKEEMKARSSSYADPWTPPRSSTSSREALHTTGYEMSFNGCKHFSVMALLATCFVPAPLWGTEAQDH